MQDSDLSQRIRNQIGGLPPTMRRVAQYMDRNRPAVLAMSAAELAAALETSDATIIRTAKALGYDGLSDLKRLLTREMSAGTPVENFRRTVSASHADQRRAALRSLQMTGDVLTNLSGEENLARLDRMISLLDQAQRIVLFGIGPTAFLTGYAAHQLARNGRETLLLNRTGRDLADQLLGLRAGDALLMISYSQPYAEALATMEEALMQALPIMLITNRTEHQLSAKAMETLIIPRGGAQGTAQNGATFACLEALIIGLSIRDPDQTHQGLNRLEQLRASIDRLG
ncbi:MurR/RpiR family transcriptional regulator [Ketogulonicigenium vulgare]|uniref:MurR/RpiR family transcriptional regulator n=1 Tax=Ketogulonicigenium vulgare TaxID=92945 RepID=UPI0023581EEA|nr:MurR/RpiR family transcriptional regulator [Ketogulonicigenium vulgare]